MNLWKVILSTLAIFTAGIFTGAFVNELAHSAPEHPRRFLQHGFPGKHPGQTNNAAKVKPAPGNFKLPNLSGPPGRGMGKDFVERLDRELHFTPEQHQQLTNILVESQAHTRTIWEKIAPELREEMKSSREKMRAVLTPEQAQRFDVLMNPAPKPPKDAIPTNAPPAIPDPQR